MNTNDTRFHVAQFHPDRHALIAGHIRAILALIEEQPEREGLLETPERWASFITEFLTPPPFTLTTFDAEGHDAMIVQTKIPFFSLCEHHLAPFFGTAAVAYIPGARICGLSKLARLVQHHARRLQNQERITQHVARDLAFALRDSQGVAVTLTGRHLCMEMRGVRTHGTPTTTSALLGLFKTDASTRAEFLALTRE